MSNKKIKWTDLAVEDLVSIRTYISKDSTQNANLVFSEILNSVDDLVQYSKKGRQIPKIDDDCYREVFAVSHRIMYKIEKETVYIVAVFHMAKNFEISDLLERE